MFGARVAFIIGLACMGLIAASASTAAANVDVMVGHDDTMASTSYLRFYPDTVVVWEGDTVTWKLAAEEFPHTVSAPPTFDSSPAVVEEMFAPLFGPGGWLVIGQSFNVTVTEAGTITYHCKVHPHMEGTLNVVDPTVPMVPGSRAPEEHITVGMGSGDTTVDRYFPAELTVETGTKVIWTSADPGEIHTVTADTENPEDEPAFDSSPLFEEENLPPEFIGEEGVLWQIGPRHEFAHTFAAAGTFPYFCKLHPAMQGAVIVLAKPEMPAPVMDDEEEEEEDEDAAPGAGLGLLLLSLGGAALVMGTRKRN